MSANYLQIQTEMVLIHLVGCKDLKTDIYVEHLASVFTIFMLFLEHFQQIMPLSKKGLTRLAGNSFFFFLTIHVN